MRLWTIQPKNVWKMLQENGYFVCNAAATNNADFFCAYNWLTEQMEERIGERPDDVIYPIWAWYTSDWQQKEPDLSEPGYKEKDTKCVCLELEIQDDRVLPNTAVKPLALAMGI